MPNAASELFSALTGHSGRAWREDDSQMQAPDTFTLIKRTPAAVDAVECFYALATQIQRRDRCDRVEALQRACHEHPDRFEEYCRAGGR